jgi:hypothetical protein
MSSLSEELGREFSAIPDWRYAVRQGYIEGVKRKRDHAVKADQRDQLDDRRPAEFIGEFFSKIGARATSFD